MDIRLKNIGIIEDSTLEIKGLTVITGKNNSGKSTVSKVLYSLIDSVSNLRRKSINDRFSYAIDQLEKSCDCFPFHLYLKKKKDFIDNECIRIYFSGEFEESILPEKIDLFLEDLLGELDRFEIEDEPYRSILSNSRHGMLLRNDVVYEKFNMYKRDAIEIIEKTCRRISGDPELIDYARQSINTALSIEFNGQIQPAALSNIKSSIIVNNNGDRCFKIDIENDEIVSGQKAVYWNSPYKSTYFIDNPLIIDEPAFRKSNKYNSGSNSFINEDRFMSHDNKLKFILKYSNPKSVFEESVINKKYKHIKNIIDNILPGEFEMSDGERFYINGTTKLNAGNLATGSKMFSIIKILIEGGNIDEDTLLILDEPEAHLHPQWQNVFAEITVLLVKEIGCHVLLTTHSSNFMLALDAYMRKYGIKDMCNFYQTDKCSDSEFISYRLVNDSLELIYKDFVTYFSNVKQIRNDFKVNDNLG